MYGRKIEKVRIGAAIACAAYIVNAEALLEALNAALHRTAGTPLASNETEIAERAWVDGYLQGASDMMHIIADIQCKTLDMAADKRKEKIKW